MSRHLRAWIVGFVLASAAGLGACAGDEVAENQCPLLCPQRDLNIVDTTFEAIGLDSVVSGFPVFGTEPRLYLATSPGDGLDVRAIMRFDSTVAVFAPSFADTLRPITAPDSARIELRVDSAASRATAPFTIEAYDVDTTVADTATAALASQFRPDKLLGARTFHPDSLRDTMRIPITGTALLVNGLRNLARLRVGLRVVSAGRVQLLVGTTDGLRDATLRYRPAADSGLPTFIFPPRSATPSAIPEVAAALADYTWVVSGSPMAPANELAIGGVPGQRAYLSVDLPARIVDSSNVIRATLELTQRPYTGPRLRDTLAIYPYLVVAGGNADVGRATTLAIGAFNALRATLGARSFTDSLRLIAGDSGVRRFDITAAVREWRVSGPNGMRRAIVLRIGPENFEAGQIRFFSREAPAGVRPRLRVVYNAARASGLP